MWSQRANLLGLPAASEIVNCHSGCRQTSKTDIICPYYPPLLRPPPMHRPSASLLFFFCPPAPFSTQYFPLFHPCARMFMNTPYLFPPSPSCRRPSATFCLSLGLFFVYKMSQLAAKSAHHPHPHPHLIVQWFIGSL